MGEEETTTQPQENQEPEQVAPVETPAQPEETTTQPSEVPPEAPIEKALPILKAGPMVADVKVYPSGDRKVIYEDGSAEVLTQDEFSAKFNA